MIITISLVNIHPLTQFTDLFLVMRTFKIYSLSNFQIYDTLLLTLVAMLCIIFPELIL